MKRITVDPDGRTARVEAGVLLGELDAATQAHGLAVPAGIVTHTGVAGLTLGGGIGWLHRKYGLTVDQLRLRHDGDRRRRGGSGERRRERRAVLGSSRGGGNFGVVTEFEFRLNELGPTVLAGPIFWPIEDSPDVLALLPRLDRRGAQRADDDRAASQGAAARLRAPRAPRPLDRGCRLLLVGRPRRRGEGDSAVAGVRLTRPRPVRAQALRGAPGDVRPELPARPLVLHALLRCRRAQRRGHRHNRGAFDADSVAADELSHLAARWRDPRGGGGGNRVRRSRSRPHVQHHGRHRG